MPATMTENEIIEAQEQVEDDVSLNMETKEKRASMSDRSIILSQGGFPVDSVQYRLYEAELKARRIDKQIEIDELILTKQHALNLEILREQQSSNKELSDNSNKTMIKAAFGGGVAGAVVAAILSLILNQTPQQNNIPTLKQQTQIEKTK